MLVEATGIGAGASGRNSGAVQHPFDPVLAPLHRRTLEVYRQLSYDDFVFPDDPAGLLLLTDDLDAAAARIAEIRDTESSLAPELLDEAALGQLEPMLADGFAAIRLATGHPIPPDAATRALGARARGAGAEVRIGQPVVEVSERGATLTDGTRITADNVLVAAGHWAPELVEPAGAWRPIRPTYGVTLQVELEAPPASILEEGAAHTVNRPVADDEPETGLITFSMVSVGGLSTVGSTFLSVAPEPATMAPALLAHGARFVPALRNAAILRSRVCARPQSIDGRPLIGPVPGREHLFVAAGHGPWGISTGPASAELAVAAILDDAVVPPELEASRML